MSPTRLHLLEKGQKARVLSVKGHGAIRRRILDMGLIPGSEVKVEGIAPLGDPMALTVKGYRLSVRKSEAAQIEVELL